MEVPTVQAVRMLSQEKEEKNPNGFTLTSSGVFSVVETVSTRGTTSLPR